MPAENANGSGNLRDRFGRFRILIIGRANAGKTTILRGICDSTENPEIYDGSGNKIDPSQVEGSRGRGQHNIENELVFRSNDNFVFHDSQGFEAGREDEFRKMKEFIMEGARTTLLNKRIHAIWYCIPMDKLDRAIQRAEEKFFGDCDSMDMLFTKFYALTARALRKLAPADRQLPLRERLPKAEPVIEDIFTQADIWARLSKEKYAPRSCVRIGDMNKTYKGCISLLENTGAVLNDEALQMLLVSAQKANITLCMKYATQHIISDINKMLSSTVPIFNTMDRMEFYKLANWFPHLWVRQFFMLYYLICS